MSVQRSYDKILVLAPLIYFSYGVFRALILNNDTIMYGSIVSILPIAILVLIYFFYKDIKDKISVGSLLLILYSIVHINEQAIAYSNGYERSDLVSIGILSIAITYTFWMKNFKQNIIIHILSIASFLSALTLTDTTLNKTYLGMIFVILSIWKLTNDFFIKRYYIAFKKNNKLDAYKETIGLLNHEFNNVNGLALLLLSRKSKKEELTKDEVELEKVLKRVSGLVKDLNVIDNYESEKYTEGIEITKL